jgi:hypothetical protein
MMRRNPWGWKKDIDAFEEFGNSGRSINGHDFTAKLIGKFSVI